jgi:DNA repair protein RecO (recombination protein O)
MAYYKTEGIVLRRTNLGEADRIITFLTPDHGKLKAVAKGVRRIKSRMAGHLELFGHVNLMLATGKNLDVITSARLSKSADNITSDFDRVSYGYLYAEMIDRLLDEGVENPELYRQVSEVFGLLGDHGSDGLLELGFKLKLLGALGYRPHLGGCTNCHREDASVDYFFSLSGGGLTCSDHATDRTKRLSHNQIKLWRLLLDHNIEQIRQLTGSVAEAAQTLAIINEFYDYTFGKRFTAQEMIGS